MTNEHKPDNNRQPGPQQDKHDGHRQPGQQAGQNRPSTEHDTKSDRENQGDRDKSDRKRL